MNDVIQKRVAVLATYGFEQAELVEPVKALREHGADVTVVSPHDGEIQGMKHHGKGDKTRFDLELSKADIAEFDALVLPGGAASPDTLRVDKNAIAFVDHFVKENKRLPPFVTAPGR